MQWLLYYPLVNPPTPIVWQGLLYWDGIASIAPWEGDHFQPLMRELRDTPLYEALDADNLRLSGRLRYDAMLSELEAIVEQIPRDDLEPEPGPLHASNRLYYGKLPLSLQEDLIAIGAAQPAGPAMRVNPRLLLAILAGPPSTWHRPTPTTPRPTCRTPISPRRTASPSARLPERASASAAGRWRWARCCPCRRRTRRWRRC
jgi:hypothetical protein